MSDKTCQQVIGFTYHLSLITYHSFWYFLMIASSLFVVGSGQRSGGVKIAFFSAEPQAHARSARASRPTASRMMTCALRTFLLRYSTTASTETASCPSCQQ